jgi:hypothetical protein
MAEDRGRNPSPVIASAFKARGNPRDGARVPMVPLSHDGLDCRAPLGARNDGIKAEPCNLMMRPARPPSQGPLSGRFLGRRRRCRAPLFQ